MTETKFHEGDRIAIMGYKTFATLWAQPDGQAGNDPPNNANAVEMEVNLRSNEHGRLTGQQSSDRGDVGYSRCPSRVCETKLYKKRTSHVAVLCLNA